MLGASVFRMPVYKLPVNMLTPRVTSQINTVVQQAWPGKPGALKYAMYNWVAMVQDQGQIVGVVFTRKSEAWTYVEKLAVLPAYRKQGVAHSLLEYIHSEVDPGNAHVLHVDPGAEHDALVRYYTKRGFDFVYSNSTETMLRRDAYAAAVGRQDEQKNELQHDPSVLWGFDRRDFPRR